MEPEPGTTLGSTRELVAEFRAQVQRTADWLNSTALDQLTRHSDGPSIADRAHDVSLAVVRSTEVIDGSATRDLPRLAAHGVGAQLCVVGDELAVAAEKSSDPFRADLELMARISDLLLLRTGG
ncbi:MAG: hypothetical protein WC054_06665 [Candidatus Nanopelagicales bacterium]